MNIQLFGGGYSQKRQNISPYKKELEATPTRPYLRKTDEDTSGYRQAAMSQDPQIKYISISKLYTDQKTVPTKDVQREVDIAEKKTSNINSTNDEPINVLLKNGKYIILSGTERVIAKRILGIKKIKARVFDLEKGRQR